MTGHLHVLRRVMLVLPLLASGPVLADGVTCGRPDESGVQGALEEESESSIRARDTTYSPKGMQAWLRRLVGQYTYEGYVDLCGKGNSKEQRTVTGNADCIATRSTPNVHCKVNVRWPAATTKDGAAVPGGVSNLAPAQLLFSIEVPSTPPSILKRGAGVNGWGLVLLQVDSMGKVEWASGVLTGDTFIATERCTDMPGQCSKTTRVTATPDGDEVAMRIDVAVDGQRLFRQVFNLHREPMRRSAGKSVGSSK